MDTTIEDIQLPSDVFDSLFKNIKKQIPEAQEYTVDESTRIRVFKACSEVANHLKPVKLFVENEVNLEMAMLSYTS